MEFQEMLMEDGTKLILVHFVFSFTPTNGFLSPPEPVASAEAPAGSLGLRSRKKAREVVQLIACVPGLPQASSREGQPWPWHRTEDPRAVTCPNCKRTAVYQNIMRHMEQEQML